MITKKDKMEKEFVLSEKRKKTAEDIEYLFSKIDWKNSFLDAKAIQIMNEFWKDVIDADKEFIRLLKEKFYGVAQKEFIDKLAGEKLI